jgi:signal peptidase II
MVEPGAAQPITRRLEFWLPIVIVAIDQATKALIRQLLTLHESVTIIPGFMDFTHVRNTGTAFGFLNGVDFPFKTLVIAIIATSALIGMAFYTKAMVNEQWLARVGMSLIIGGAAGNLIDRVTVGSVVDFVDVYWRDWHFWAFNVADSAITVGVALIILDMIGVGSRVSKTA